MILFIDDEPRHVASYADALRDNGYVVEMAQNTDHAVERFDSSIDVLELVVMDIMMPPGNAFQGVNTLRGRRTGVAVYRRLRAVHRLVPVIILTNVSDPELERHFATEERLRFCKKYEWLPDAFVDVVKEMLGA